MLIDLLFAIFGAFFGAILAILWENSRKPNLVIESGSTADGNYSHNLGAPSRFIHLRITNAKWPKWWKNLLFGVKPALLCKSKLTFLNPQTRAEIFSFQGRWSSTSEPLNITNPKEGEATFDPSKAVAGEAENILPSETKEISVALKVEGKDEFVGFNNWSYQWHNWTNPDWVVGKGSVLVKAEIWWDSGKTERCFVIVNEQRTIKSFQIKPYAGEEYQKIEKP